MAKAILNNEGQLKSEITDKNISPIIVSSDKVVENLNADKIDGLDSTSFLRTDGDSVLEAGKKLTANGDIEVKGKLSLGDFEIAQEGGYLVFKVKEE